MKKRTLIILALVLAFFAAAGLMWAGGSGEKAPASGTTETKTTETKAAPKEPIKIGVAGAHSGDLASYGLPTVKAAELVAELYNAKGGVLGRQIQLVVEDDVCKPEVATNIAAKLVGEKVVFVLGHICSGATKAALGIYKDSNILVMSPSATNPPLTQSGEYPNFLRTIAADDAQAQLEVDFALNTLKVTKIAILHDKGDYGKGLAEFAQTYVTASGKGTVVLYEGITVGAVDYSAIINKIGASGAQALIYGGYHPEASKLISQMRKKSMDIIFISDDGVKDDTFIKVAGEYAEGVYATGPKDTTSNPMAIAATKAHQAKYGSDPGAFFLNAYAAMIAILNGIEKAGSTDSAAVSKALRSNYVDTPLGNISFDAKGDAIGVGFSMYQVKNGVYVEVAK
ncbi:MAG: branched-chain amino acid ABC transporter substrate-binding protein [Spirochaetales bacterium]|nr:MAG: branched-chain amino acid ABC transporter substrate-binding protein [Spirochaetales bacterium]